MHLVCMTVVLRREMSRVLIALAAHQGVIVVRRDDYPLLNSEPAFNDRRRIDAGLYRILGRPHS